MVYSAVKNRKIDWAKRIYDDLFNKLRLPQSSKQPQRQTTVLYPRFLSRVIRLRYEENDTYPPGNHPYSEIGNTMLNNKRHLDTDVRLRHVIHPLLLLALTDPSGMYSIIFFKSPSSLSIAVSHCLPQLFNLFRETNQLPHLSPHLSKPRDLEPSKRVEFQVCQNLHSTSTHLFLKLSNYHFQLTSQFSKKDLRIPLTRTLKNRWMIFLTSS